MRVAPRFRVPGPEDALRAAYAVESAAESRRGAEVACFLAIPLVPLFAVLDAVVFPDHAVLFLQVRLACVAACAGILWLLQRPFGHRHPVGIGVVLTIILGAMIQVMVLLTGGAASSYYAGLNLILLAVALLMPWSIRSSQVDEEAAARYGGTGLGLSISRKLAELLGGRIAVRTRYQHGSTFALVLPAPASAWPAAA